METKKCRICGEEKSLDCFYFHHLKGQYKYISDKYKSECKTCGAGFNRKYRENNKEHLRQYRIAHKPRFEAWKKENWTEVKKKASSRKCWLKLQNGIAPEEYDQMLKAQNGKCAICGAIRGNKRSKNFMVDHDHGTNKIRGLLCTKCNQGVGCFNDNPTLLRKAAEYLET